MVTSIGSPRCRGRVAELVNLPPHPADPYVGSSAFAHKGGLHTSALGRVGGASYEHVDPAAVGNHTRVLVSDLGGRAGMAMKAAEFGVDLDGRAAAELSETLKRLEADGYVFEAADASLELLMRRANGWEHDFFSVEAYRVSAYHREGLASPTNGVDLSTEATVKLWVDDERLASVGEGNGPVNALDAAVRAALTERYPAFDADPPHRLQGQGARQRRRPRVVGHGLGRAGPDRFRATAARPGRPPECRPTSSRRRGRR